MKKKLGKLLKKADEHELVEPIVFLLITVLVIGLILAFRLSSSNYSTGTNFLTGFLGLGSSEFNVTVIEDLTCTACYDTTQFMNLLKADYPSMKITSTKVLDYSSSEAKELIDKYNITLIPTILFSKEALSSPIKEWLTEIVTVEAEGILVLRRLNPVYRNLTSGKILYGDVEAAYLMANNCDDCYDPLLIEGILNYYGIFPFSSLSIDYASQEGKELVEKYDILEVPAIILSPNTANYLIFFEKAWLMAGSVESDGYLVFRHNSVLENVTYHDLVKNITITTT